MVMIVAFSVSGCGKKADPKKPIDQVKTEAEKMSAKDLEATAKAYVQEIAAKKTEVREVTSQVKSLSPSELFGDKAKNLKDEISRIVSDVSALTERYEIYARKYQELGGDLSNIKVS